MTGPAASQPPRPPTPASTVLVVDDESTVINLCKTILQEAGWTVLSADDSSDALKLCTQHQGPIHLLLTDLVLPPQGFQLASGSNEFPHVHGHELAIRAAANRKDLRIILMSADPAKELASFGLKPDFLPVLAKPFEKQGLINLVRNVLAKPAPSLGQPMHGKAANDEEWFG